MPSVGKRLQDEREARNTTLDQMAAATGIGRSYLEALERDEIGTLPGPAFGKLYIRAYAEVLGFDPQRWIDDYDREQRRAQGASAEPAQQEPSRPRPVADAIARWKESRTAADQPAKGVEAEPVVEDVRSIGATPEAPFAPKPAATARRMIIPLLVSGAVAIAVFFHIGTRKAREDTSSSPTSEAPQPVQPGPQVRPPELSPPASKAPVTRPPGVNSALTVSEFGVGRRIVDRRIEGEGDRFDTGERVCFATRVIGGRRGDVVRHVWLYEGRIEQTITLRVGGPDWRTHSNKTLGSAGSWAVEARDEAGGVLARAAFTCGPAR